MLPKKQVYLGGFMDEEKASEMRDMVTSKVRGTNTKRNIPLERLACDLRYALAP